MDRKLYESMNEKQQRLYLGQKAKTYGHGGIGKVAKEYGVSRNKVSRGLHEYEAGISYHRGDRIREAGGGRKKKTEEYPGLEKKVLELAEANNGTYGSPTDQRKWTAMSCRKVSRTLREEDHINVCANVIAGILKKNHYSRQQNRKMKEVSDPGPHRDEQFQKINEKIDDFMASNDPVISIDAKKRKS